MAQDVGAHVLRSAQPDVISGTAAICRRISSRSSRPTASTTMSGSCLTCFRRCSRNFRTAGRPLSLLQRRPRRDDPLNRNKLPRDLNDKFIRYLNVRGYQPILVPHARLLPPISVCWTVSAAATKFRNELRRAKLLLGLHQSWISPGGESS